MGASLEDIALKCGCSRATVSRALDPAKSHLISEKTRNKIEECARAMDYLENLNARRLRTGKTRTIAMILPQFMLFGDPTGDFQDVQVFAEEIETAFSEISDKKYELKFNVYTKESCREDIEKIRLNIDSSLCDGVLFFGHIPEMLAEQVIKKQLPSVLICRDQYRQGQLPQIGLNRCPGVELAAEHLISLVKKRIVYLSTKLKYGAKFNCDCFSRKLETLGSPVEIEIIADRFDIRRWVASENFAGVDAVLCANDTIADSLVKELRFCNINVPEDIAVIGYNKSRVYQRPESSQLSSVSVDRVAMTRAGVALLLNMIRQGTCSAEDIIFETGFFRGKTS